METNSNFSKLIEEAVKKGLTPYDSALTFMNKEVAKQREAEKEKATPAIAVEEIVVGEEPAAEDVKREEEDFVR